MIKEVHAYRYVSWVENPEELSECLKEFKTGGPREGDRGRNVPYQIDNLTLVLSLASGKLSIYANKKEDLDKLGFLPDGILSEIKRNLRQYRREIRTYKPLGTKRRYSEDHLYEANSIGKGVPSTQSNLQVRKQLIDGLDVKLLRCVYFGSDCSFSIPRVSTLLHIGYHKSRRRLIKLYGLGLLEKLGKSPAIYVPTRNDRVISRTREFIGIWDEIIGKSTVNAKAEGEKNA